MQPGPSLLAASLLGQHMPRLYDSTLPGRRKQTHTGSADVSSWLQSRSAETLHQLPLWGLEAVLGLLLLSAQDCQFSFVPLTTHVAEQDPVQAGTRWPAY